MPDQYDPKQAPRSPYGRPAEQKAAPAPLDDPLAELARMVHGRPSQTSPATSRAAAQAEPSPAGDLESELLTDLQASFAAVREAAAAVATPAPRPQPVAPPPALEPPRSRPAPMMPEPTYPTSFAPRPQPAPPPPRLEPRAEARADIRPEFRLEPLDESRLVPIPQAPVMQPAALGGGDRAAEPRGGTVEPFPRLFERAARQAAAPTPEDDEFAAFRLRPSSPPVTSPEAAAPSPRAQPPAPSRWEKPEPAEPPPAVSRFAPPAAGAVPVEEEFGDEEPDPFVDAGLLPQAGAPEDDEFETDEFGLAPDYADHDDDAGRQHTAARPARVREPTRPSRGVVIVAAVVAIALVGGIAVAMFRTGQRSATAPATIMADGAPTKITPDTTTTPATGEGDAQNKLIYDRVNSAEANNNTTLLTPDNGPIKGTSDANDGNAISRVILPGGPGYDARTAPDSAAPAATGSAPASGAASDSDTLGPKKVRTVVVRPDGTILSSSATDATSGAQTGDANANAAPATANAPATPDTTAAAPAPATGQDDMVAIAGTGGGALTITAAPDATSAPAIPTPAPTPRTEATVSAPAPAKAAKAPQVAAANPNGPLDLTPGGSAATAPPATAADGFYVQVSSQHTEDAARATYKDLQTRYPSILGKYDVSLQQATVPTRGTFYRVRVGPFSATDAQRLCDDLKSAGGDCVLARR